MGPLKTNKREKRISVRYVIRVIWPKSAFPSMWGNYEVWRRSGDGVGAGGGKDGGTVKE